MNDINTARQRESDISSYSNGESSEGSYENYRSNSLPEGYTPYRDTSQTDETVYDQYNPDYDGYEIPGEETKPISCADSVSCCKIGWLLIS